VAALPGVEAVTAMDPVPLWFGSNNAHFSIADAPQPAQAHRLSFARVAPGYFATLRIPLLRGRDFTRADSESAPRVAIVNEALARRLWPDGTALGQRLDRRDGVLEIVGVAANSKYLSLAETSRPWIYVPLAQDPTNHLTLSLAVRGTGDSMRLTGAIEREVRALVPTWPSFHFRTLDEGLQFQRLVPRFGATLLGVLGAFALVLATIGIYGVMAYVARQRSHEIGIRLALGAQQVNVLTLVIRQGMAVCLVGGAIGIAVSLGLTNFMSDVLFGVGAADVVTYTIVPASLFGVALSACYLPARRAASVNPLDVLRRE
jgi:putative ABC transport system permease protein